MGSLVQAQPGNEVIKNLDRSIKQNNTEFPNNKSQEDFLNTILEIATVYDSIVAATKLNPGTEGYLPVDAANTVIEDLRIYTQKYLDVDLTAAFSVFNESYTEDTKADDDLNKNNSNIKVLDYGDPHKLKKGYIDNPMPKGTGFANESTTNKRKIKITSIPNHSYPSDKMFLDRLCLLRTASKVGDEEVVNNTQLGKLKDQGVGYDIINETINENNKALKGQVKDKFADTKSAIKSGDLEAYKTERIKTLKSWRLPAALFGAGASFGALSWLVHYMFPPEEITKLTPETVKQATEELFGNIEPGEGMTQIMNRLLGTNLTPNSSPNDIVSALSKLGGGDAKKGIDIITQNGGIFKDPVAAKETLSAIVSNPTEHGNTLKQVFSGTWAGTGKAAGDTLVTITGGQLSGIVVKAVTTWVAKTTVIKSAKAAIAAPILKTLGIALASGAVVVALSRYKGRKSSRAQILNDLVQYIRPVPEDSKNNPSVVDTQGSESVSNNKQGGESVSNDTQMYNYLKKYFQDIFNFKSQVNTSTYGQGGSSNTTKQYGTGGNEVTKKITKPNDIDDILKLMEGEFKLFNSLSILDSLIYEADNSINKAISAKGDKVDNSNKSLSDSGLSTNEIKLFKTHITRLTQLIKLFKNFNTQDKNLQKLVDQLKSNPIFTENIDVNTLLSSDPKSLKIFVSDFNKTVYSTQFKNGNNIMDQLKKIGINKLQEVAQRTPSKSSMNAIYNTRRNFIKNYSGLIKSFYAILSYLIDLKGKSSQQIGANTQQSKTSGANKSSNTNQSGGSGNNTGGSSSNQSKNIYGRSTQQTGNQQQGNNSRLPWEWDPNDKSTWEMTEDYKLLEVIETHNNLNQIIENVIKEKLTSAMVDAKSDAVKNSDSGRIFTQLANVIPELSNKIANEYKNQYNQQINRIKLSEFLKTILGSLANLPKSKMIQLINRSDMDISAYNKMLKAIKTPEDGKDVKGDVEQKEVNLPEFNPNKPEKFQPNVVGKYDLSKINQAARTALSQKAAEIISRQTDMTLNGKNMVAVMTQLLNDISATGRKLPTV